MKFDEYFSLDKLSGASSENKIKEKPLRKIIQNAKKEFRKYNASYVYVTYIISNKKKTDENAMIDTRAFIAVAESRLLHKNKMDQMGL